MSNDWIPRPSCIVRETPDGTRYEAALRDPHGNILWQCGHLYVRRSKFRHPDTSFDCACAEIGRRHPELRGGRSYR